MEIQGTREENGQKQHFRIERMFHSAMNSEQL